MINMTSSLLSLSEMGGGGGGKRGEREMEEVFAVSLMIGPTNRKGLTPSL